MMDQPLTGAQIHEMDRLLALLSKKRNAIGRMRVAFCSAILSLRAAADHETDPGKARALRKAVEVAQIELKRCDEMAAEER